MFKHEIYFGSKMFLLGCRQQAVESFKQLNDFFARKTSESLFLLIEGKSDSQFEGEITSKASLKAYESFADLKLL